MDSTEVNKVMAAFLTAGLVFGFGGVLGSWLVRPAVPEKPAFAIAGPAQPQPAAAPRGPMINALLASADPARGGADAAKLCGFCHSFNKGGATIVGPNLWGVVGTKVGDIPGYDFSSSLKGKGGTWTFAALDSWLKDPKSFASGTKMAFAGIANDRQRADVIDYLRTQSDHPEPLPPAGGGGASAGGAAGGASAFTGLVAHADVKQGQQEAQQDCAMCHSLAKGGPTIVGPDLYDVVDRPIASVAGYEYSSALKDKHGNWTYDTLNSWLTDPAAFAHGTKMTFAGLHGEKQRAALVAYLRTLAAKPAPLQASASPGSASPASSTASGGGGSGPSFAGLVGKADVGQGQQTTQQSCAMCHSLAKGGPTIVGPDLYGVVDRPIASVPGYEYSSALKDKHGNWTYDALNDWLTDPAAYAHGTKMTFAGIHSEKQRAGVVAYLRTLAGKPAPLPGAK